MNPKVHMEVREHEGWWYAFLECKDVGFSDCERMPDKFLEFDETQRGYWGSKIFGKLERKLNQHMKLVKPLIPPKSSKEKRKESAKAAKVAKAKSVGSASGKRVRAQ